MALHDPSADALGYFLAPPYGAQHQSAHPEEPCEARRLEGRSEIYFELGRCSNCEKESLQLGINRRSFACNEAESFLLFDVVEAQRGKSDQRMPTLLGYRVGRAF
jgi:hypothetical protein